MNTKLARFSELDAYLSTGWTVLRKTESGLIEMAKPDDEPEVDLVRFIELEDEVADLKKSLAEIKKYLGELLHGINPNEDGEPVTLGLIASVVCREYDVTLAELRCDRRAREVARPRQIFCWLAKRMTSHSLPTIGRYVRRDHTTVTHAVRTVRTLRERDPRFCANTNAVRDAVLAAAVRTGGEA